VRPIQLRKNLLALIEDAEQNLSACLRWLLERLWQEWKQVEVDLKTITDESSVSARRMRFAGVCARSLVRDRCAWHDQQARSWSTWLSFVRLR
jgi:hypothetical protein